MKNGIHFLIVTIFTVALFSLQGCTATEQKGTLYKKDGKVYGTTSGKTFRHRWWNYFERALSYMEGEYYDEAASDLKAALAQREKDQRRARTYGMHFMDYFPNRELGVIYFKQGDLEAAESHLTRSIQQYPTSKAHYYLDQVRSTRITSSKAHMLPPEILLDEKTPELWTRDDPVIISGTVHDPLFVSQISINGHIQYMEGSQHQVTFHQELSLPQGAHSIQVVARNLGAIESRKVLTVHVDQEGPQIVLTRLEGPPIQVSKGLTLFGTAIDDTVVDEITINGAPVVFKKGRVADFSHVLPPNVNKITIHSRDQLGNITSVTTDITNESRTDKIASLYAGLSFNTSGFSSLLLSKGKNQNPPMIEIKAWRDTETVFLDAIYIEGEVSSQESIASLTLNGESILKREGKRILFSRIVKLEEGKNDILITAQDTKGETARKAITVTRVIPPAFKFDARMRLTVFPFQKKGLVVSTEAGFQEYLLSALVSCDRFKMLEREMLSAILTEQNISASNLVDTKTKIHVGRLAAVQAIIAGHIIETRDGVEVIARIVDTETSEILVTTDVYSEDKTQGDWRRMAQGMALKIHREFPLLTGLVLERKGNILLIDLGQDKLRAQRYILIFESTPVYHPVSGTLLGEDQEILGHGRVLQINEALSKVEIRSETQPLEKMDRIVTE